MVLKKLISVILSATFLCSVFAINTNAFIDTNESKKLNEATGLLTSLDIMKGKDETNFGIYEPMTRGEAACVIARFMNLSDNDASLKVSFKDVSDEQANYISMLTERKIIDNNGELFQPDNPITYNEMLKLIVCALGYRQKAESYGRYPEAYIRMATELGINKGLDSNPGGLTRSDAALIVYNSLFVDVMQQTHFGSNFKYEVKKGEDALFIYHSVTQSKGIIDSTSDTALKNPVSRLSDDEVSINGVVYKIGLTDAPLWLGYNTRFYYKEEKDKDQKTLIYINLNYTENDFTRILAEDISDYSNYSLYFHEDSKDNKAKKISLNNDIAVIINGKAEPKRIVKEDLTFELGYVIVLDNNNDGINDVLFIVKYENYIVGGVDAKNNIIFDYYTGDKLDLDKEAGDKKIYFIKDRAYTQFRSIKKWDVLSVAVSHNSIGKKLVQVFITQKVINGMIEGVSNDTVIINNIEYTVSKLLLKKLESQRKKLNLGDNGNFYFDISEKIAAVDLNKSDDEQYGFIIAATKHNGVSNSIDISILSERDGMTKYENVKKVIVDKQLLKGADNILTKLEQSASAIHKPDPSVYTNKDMEIKYSQLIRYRKNGEGIINEIDTNIYSPINGENDKSLKLSVDYEKTVNCTYRLPNRVFYQNSGSPRLSLTAVDNETVVFVIPEQRNQTEEYSVRTYEYFKDLSTDYKFEAFDCSDANIAKAIVVYSKGSNMNYVNADTPPSIIMSKSVALNSEGQESQKLKVYTEGSLKNITALEPELFSGLNIGDVIRYEENNAGDAVALTKVLDIGNLPAAGKIVGEGSNSTIYKAQYRTYYGMVYAKEKNYLRLTTSMLPDIEQLKDADSYLLSSTTRCYVYNKDNTDQRKVYVGTMDEIKDYKTYGSSASKVFVYSRRGTVIYVYVIIN